MISLGNITGPFLAGSLYLVWNGLPYVISSLFFILAIIVIKFNFKKF